MKRQEITIISFVLLLCFSACQPQRYLAEGEKLYSGAKIEIIADSISSKELRALQSELDRLPRPKPNTKVLGMWPKMFAYQLAGEPKKEKGLRHKLRNRYGEAPVLDYMVDTDFNSRLIQNRLENRGYFQAEVIAETLSKGQKSKVKYIAKPGKRYTINEVHFPADSSALSTAIKQTADQSLLKTGAGYNLETIKRERVRIDQTLKEMGYFYFNPDHILIKADTTIGHFKVNLFLTIKPETPLPSREKYSIGNILIYPNHSINQLTTTTDTLKHNNLTIIGNNNTFKPGLFSRSIFIKSGELYQRQNHNQSLNRLISTGAFKLVSNRFEANHQAKTPTLDAIYYLTPLPKHSLQGEVLATTKSNNLSGTGLSLSWRNRNTFGSAELLTVKAYGSYEAQFSRSRANYNTYRFGGETSLSIPRFVLPFREISTSKQFVPRTHFTLAYEILNRRELYRLNTFSTLGGYKWKSDIKTEHELNILSINYVRSSDVSDKYLQRINENPLLRKVIEPQLIFGPNYSFTYNSQLERVKTNNFYFHTNIDLAGSLTGAVQQANHTSNPAFLFGNQYAQYAKIDADIRHYFKPGANMTIATRLMAGVGLPYGNSRELPFVKQYYSGGTNSLRAFMARSVGPGSYRPTESQLNSFLPDQSGDIILEMNAEYRTKLFSIVHGALFVDAGNVWLFNANSNEPGAHFTRDFINEMAVGAGFGLRFDITFLVLRTDIAFPLRKPWLNDRTRWVINDFAPEQKTWRKENLVFNLAIGYPF